MTATNSGISVSLLLSVLCLGLAVICIGGWYFQSSLVELKAQQQETVIVVQQLREKVKRQNKQLIELRLRLEVSLTLYSYYIWLNTICIDICIH